MSVKLVIFDLDGTILNTYADIAAATNQALARLGFPTHDVPTIKSFVGNGINKLFERALPVGYKDEANVLEVRKLFVPYYNEHGTENTFPFEGIPQLMSRLNEAGIKIAVASNKYHQATAALIPHFFPNIEFAAVYGQREGVAPKPDPTIVYDIMNTAGERAENTLYVGDSGVDMQTANNAKLKAVGVTWGCRMAEELRLLNPYAIVDNVSQLEKIIFEDV